MIQKSFNCSGYNCNNPTANGFGPDVVEVVVAEVVDIDMNGVMMMIVAVVVAAVIVEMNIVVAAVGVMMVVVEVVMESVKTMVVVAEVVGIGSDFDNMTVVENVMAEVAEVVSNLDGYHNSIPFEVNSKFVVVGTNFFGNRIG